MLFETHCHLMDVQFDSDREEVIERAFSSGISHLVEIADNESEWPRAQDLAKKHPGKIFWTAGFHPHYADQADSKMSQRLRDVLKDPQCVAVGEIGIDYCKSTVSPETQKKVFEETLLVAQEVDKPVVLHCRESDPSKVRAQEDMLFILRKVFSGAQASSLRGVAHCFQGTPEHAKEFMDMGFYIGVDGPVTYPKAHLLRDMIQTVPLERLVLETDCPYLPPQPKRGTRNEPSYLSMLLPVLADLKQTTIEIVQDVSTKNAKTLYKIGL